MKEEEWGLGKMIAVGLFLWTVQVGLPLFMFVYLIYRLMH